MYDPKFERAIQQKMEELEFRPPESVWVNIEKAVVVRRRRRAAILWRYLVPAILVVAAAGIYWYQAGEKSVVPGAAAGGAVTAQTVRSSGGLSTANAGLQGTAGRTSKAGQTARGEQTTAFGENTVAGKNKPAGNSAAAGISAAAAGFTADYKTTGYGATVMSGGASTAGETITTREIWAAGRAGAAGRLQAGGQKGPDAWFYLPGLADQRLTPQVEASVLSTKKSNTVSIAKLSHPQRHWEAGFVAGGGLSRLNGLHSDQAKVALNPSITSLFTISNAASSTRYIADVRPEASFEGGIYLQRPLSDRWVLNTGMNLHYYSNRISVGQQVTTYVSSSASYLLSSTVQTTAATSLYSAGDTRSVINKYYFLELPAGLQWKVNKSHLLPIFVEGDVSLSRLMGASALFYNAKTGLYSKDGDIVNKTQFTIGSAVLVGLPFHGITMQLGPQIQYGLTALVNTQGVGDQHLLYTGVRLVIIPGRK